MRVESLRGQLCPFPDRATIAQEKIFVAHSDSLWSSEVLAEKIVELDALAENGDVADILAKIKEIVPEYQLDFSAGNMPSPPP